MEDADGIDSRLGTLSPHTSFSPHRGSPTLPIDITCHPDLPILETEEESNFAELTFFNPSLANGQCRSPRLKNLSGNAPRTPSSKETNDAEEENFSSCDKREEYNSPRNDCLVLNVSPGLQESLQATPFDPRNQTFEGSRKYLKNENATHTSSRRISLSPFTNKSLSFSPSRSKRESISSHQTSNQESDFSPQTSNREKEFGCSTVDCTFLENTVSPSNDGVINHFFKETLTPQENLNVTFFNPSLSVAGGKRDLNHSANSSSSSFASPVRKKGKKDIVGVLTSFCSNCSEGAAARFYCFACLETLCKTCHEAHQRVRVTRDHEVATIGKTPLYLQ